MPVLRVADMSRAVDWYTQCLGFQVCWRRPNDGDGENCMLRADETNLLLSTGSHLGGKPSFTGTIYFDIDGVEEYFARVSPKVEVVWPLESMDYGTLEFGIRDLDGYLLAFAQDKAE